MTTKRSPAGPAASVALRARWRRPPRDLVAGVAALLYGAAEVEDGTRFASIPRGAATRTLRWLLSLDPTPTAAFRHLARLRRATRTSPRLLDWAIDALETEHELDRLLAAPPVWTEVREVLGGDEHDHSGFIALASDRLRRGEGQPSALAALRSRLLRSKVAQAKRLALERTAARAAPSAAANSPPVRGSLPGSPAR